MKRIYFHIAILLLIQIPADSQQPIDSISHDVSFAKGICRPLNNISVNLFGDISSVSIEYERMFKINDKFLMVTKLGIGYTEEFSFCFGLNCDKKSYLTIPHGISFMTGAKNIFFEFGIGSTWIANSNAKYYTLYPVLAFRTHPRVPNKFTFRIGLTWPVSALPFLIHVDEATFITLPVGISLGSAF